MDKTFKKFQDSILGKMESIESDLGNYGVYVMKLESTNQELTNKVEELKHLKNWLGCNHKTVLRDWNMKQLTQQPKEG